VTDRVIRIVVDPSGIQRGLRAGGAALQRFGGRVRGVGQRIFTLRNALVGVVGALGIRQLIRTADAYQQVQNRLRIVTDSTDELTAANERLFAIAQDTRQEFGATVSLFSRASIAAGELGASQEELFELVEITGQALAVQGGAASEASGALRQLSQAFSSGIVRAEEFNSILEGAFPLAQAVARGLDEAGGSVGRLRNLVIEGKVSSEEFFRAILKGGEGLGAQFAKTIPTVSQSITNLKNSFQFLVGGIDQATGATGAISVAIRDFSMFLDENREEIIEWVNTTVEGVIVGGRAIFDFVTSLDTQLAGLVADVIGTTGVIGERFGAALEFVSFGQITGVREFFDEQVETAIGARAEIDAELKGIEDRFLAFTDRLATREEFADPSAGEEFRIPVDPNAADDISEARDAIEEFGQALAEERAELELQAELGDDAAESIQRLREDFALAATEAEIFGELLPSEAVDELRENFQRLAEEGLEANRALREEIAAAELSQEFEDEIEALEEELLLLDANNMAIAINAEVRALAAGATEEQAARIRELTETLLDEKAALEDALPTLADFFEDVSESAESTLTGIIADPLQEGLDEVPFKFAQLLQQLAAEALAAEVFDILGNLGGGGGGGGGFLSFVGGLFGGGFQAGGTVRGGQPILVGERGPELFTPPGSGSISPNVNISQAAQAPPMVNVINVSDPADIPSGIETPEGEQAVINVIQKNPEAVRRLLG
jgi:tape measure domain-containing protein